MIVLTRTLVSLAAALSEPAFDLFCSAPLTRLLDIRGRMRDQIRSMPKNTRGIAK